MFKRLEIYVWWTCNQKCTYCMEFPNMEEKWKKRVTKYDILKYLLKYKKLWYNHVTLLWWEPFIQAVFKDALLLSKKFNFTTLVTTNATTLHIDSQAKKFLPYIDELILSVEAIDENLQKKISRTNTYVKWDKVFLNIKKYRKGPFLKANIVITKDNLFCLFDLFKFVVENWINNVALTYPDLYLSYYWKKHLIDRVAPRYEECIESLDSIANYSFKNNINLKIVDFPFCIFPIDKAEDYIKVTDDFDYSNRLKIWFWFDQDSHIVSELDRSETSPRYRKKIKECNKCIYNKICWGPSISYKNLYWYSEIKAILN